MFVNCVRNSSLYFNSKIWRNVFDNHKIFSILKNEKHRKI